MYSYGQLYFFRGWFHFELMQYFGGLPYIDSVPSSSEPLRNPRLSYQECVRRDHPRLCRDNGRGGGYQDSGALPEDGKTSGFYAARDGTVR